MSYNRSNITRNFHLSNNKCLCGGFPYYFTDCKDGYRPPVVTDTNINDGHEHNQNTNNNDTDAKEIDWQSVEFPNFLHAPNNHKQPQNKHQRHKKSTKKKSRKFFKKTKHIQDVDTNEIVDYQDYTGPRLYGYDYMDFSLKDKVYKCEFKGRDRKKCGYSSSRKNDLCIHYQAHLIASKLRFECKLCGLRRSTKKGMVDHLRKCRGGHVIKCPVCDKIVNDYTARKRCKESHNV